MNFQASVNVSLSLFAIAASFVSVHAESGTNDIANQDTVEQLAFAVLLKGEKTEQVVKRDGPISVLATDKCGQHRALIEEAVADINQAFGYGKLALQWRDEVRAPREDEIVFLLGSVSEGRLLIERAGVSSPGSFRSGSYRYWYKNHAQRSLIKGLAAIDDSLPSKAIAVLARSHLLSILGFRGTTRSLRPDQSFFSSDYLSKRPREGEGFSRPQMLTEADSAMLRFSDRWVAASMDWNMVRNVFDGRWSESVGQFTTPGLSRINDSLPDRTDTSIASAPDDMKPAEPKFYSAQRKTREAVLACDVVVSIGDANNKEASFRLQKGYRGRVIEEQPYQSLLFFGSDRLIYVPSEAIIGRGVTPPNEVRAELIRPRDNTERIAANGMLEKRFKLNVNQMQLFRGSEGKKFNQPKLSPQLVCIFLREALLF